MRSIEDLWTVSTMTAFVSHALQKNSQNMVLLANPGNSTDILGQ